jgi:hypothetical protein
MRATELFAMLLRRLRNRLTRTGRHEPDQSRQAPQGFGARRLARWWGKLATAVAFVVLFAVGVAAASIINDPVAQPDATVGPDAYVWDGTPASIPVSVGDPEGRERWAVRQYRSKKGLPCIEIGRLEGNDASVADFGRVDDAGAFKRLPIDAGGSPVDIAESSHALLIDHYYRPDSKQVPQAAIFGMTTGDVKAVVLHLASGATTTIPIVESVFLAVRAESDLRGADVTFELNDGTTKTYNLRAKPPQDSPGPGGTP